MKFTILGGSGFIGSNLVKYLQEQDIDCFSPARGDQSVFDEHLGHVIYCVGLTADFRQKPFQTVEAHVCHLSQILQKCRFDSFLYLSSTRVYCKSGKGLEKADLAVSSLDPDDLYNISKLMGESLCLSSQSKNIRIARLSNVIGQDFDSHNFLTDIIKSAVSDRHVTLKSSIKSAKDYIGIADVVKLLKQISLSGKRNIYNVASGKNTPNSRIIKHIQSLTECRVDLASNCAPVIFPKISVSAIRKEFGYQSTDALELITGLVAQYKDRINK